MPWLRRLAIHSEPVFIAAMGIRGSEFDVLVCHIENAFLPKMFTKTPTLKGQSASLLATKQVFQQEILEDEYLTNSMNKAQTEFCKWAQRQHRRKLSQEDVLYCILHCYRRLIQRINTHKGKIISGQSNASDDTTETSSVNLTIGTEEVALPTDLSTTVQPHQMPVVNVQPLNWARVEIAIGVEDRERFLFNPIPVASITSHDSNSGWRELKYDAFIDLLKDVAGSYLRKTAKTPFHRCEVFIRNPRYK